MQGRNVIRAVLFALFFSIGAAALSISILCDDLVQHYQNTELLRAAQKSLDRLKSLNADYGAVLDRLQADPNDPNSVKHLRRAILGPDPNRPDPNTVYPRATAEQLAAAHRALTADSGEPTSGPLESGMPRWLDRCREPRRKMTLFFSGVILILTSLVCFGRAKQTLEIE